MMFDFADLPESGELSADVCIIGSGPAGVTLARELAGRRLRIVLLESGGRSRSAKADALNAIENVGSPRTLDQTSVRVRALGGTSVVWTGRCAPLDPMDYQVRPWVPYSGWPVTAADTKPYFDRSAAHLGLGLGSGFTEFGPPVHTRRKRLPLGSSSLQQFFWQFSRDARWLSDSMDFGRRLLRDKPDGVRVVLNATAVHINTDGGAVNSVEFAGPDGARRTIAAPIVALCTGGIENARLLLASNRVASAGLGNAHGMVGRCLMDHPRGSVARFDHRQASALRMMFGLQVLRTGHGPYVFCKGLQLSPQAQEKRGLLNCAVWLSEVVLEDDPWSALKRVLQRRSASTRDAGAIVRNLGLFAHGVHRGVFLGDVIPRKLGGLMLDCTVEQRPDPDSRVMLSDKLDRNGIPLARIDWRVNEQEQRTVREMAALVVEECTRLSLPVPVLDEWVVEKRPFPSDFGDVAHHIGTTRMSADPATGVVDADCQVHGIRGLFVGGSSVFPTAGHVNPTQAIVALAIRLADTLIKTAKEYRATINVVGSKAITKPYKGKTEPTPDLHKIDRPLFNL